MRKRVSRSLFVFMTLMALFLPVTLVHADGEVVFTTPTVECQVGDTVSIECSISTPVTGAQIGLSISDGLSFVSASGTGISGGPNPIVFLSDGAELKQVSFTITLSALSSGEKTIEVKSLKLSDVDEQSIAGVTGTVATIIVSEKNTEPPETDPPTDPPTDPSTEPPTEPPTEAPTEPPTEAPTEPPTEAPTDEPAPTEPPTEPSQRVPSSNALLSALSLAGGGSLSPAFDSNTFRYRLEIPTDVRSLQISYSLQDARANAWFNSYLRDIAYGETDFFIHVTAEDGKTVNEYHVTVYRPWPPQSSDQPAPPVTAAPTQPAPTEAPTEAPEETTEPAEESTDPAEESSDPAESTEVDEKDLLLSGLPLLFKILPIPKDDPLPAGYALREIKTADGNYEALLPAGVRKPTHYILYGVRMKEAEPGETTEAPSTAEGETLDPEATEVPQLVEDGTPEFYVYDLEQKTLQRMGLVIEPTTEATTEAPTEPTTEATTEAPTEAPTTLPATTAAPTTVETVPPPTDAPAPSRSVLGNIPWYIWLVAAGLLGVGGYAIAKVVGGKKDQDEEEVKEPKQPKEPKTHNGQAPVPPAVLQTEEMPQQPEEKEAVEDNSFLDVGHEELGATLQAGPDAWTVEDLDKVLEQRVEEHHISADPKNWIEGEGDLFGTEELFQDTKIEDQD